MLANPSGAAEALQLMANEIELMAQKLEAQTMFAQADDLREQARRLRLDARECLTRSKTSPDAETQSARRRSQEQQWQLPDQSQRNLGGLRQLVKAAVR
jgi:hypothetical protein